MSKTYEINGSVFHNKGMTLGECYTLSNTAEIDNTDTLRYTTLDDALQIKSAQLDKFVSITIYEWLDNEITNVFCIK